ncbi:Cellulosome-anchoring protein precursor [compost metagenome]
MFIKLGFRKVSVMVLVMIILSGMFGQESWQRVHAADEGATLTSPVFNEDGTVTVQTNSLKSEMYINGNFTDWKTFMPMSLTGNAVVDGVQQNVFSYKLKAEDFNKTGGVVQYKFVPQAAWTGGDYADPLNASPKIGGNTAVYYLKLAILQKQLQPGQSSTVEAYRYLADGNKVDLTKDVDWTSTEPSYITIKDGVLSVASDAKLGNVTLTGVYQGISATLDLAVVESPPVPAVKSVANLTDLNDRLLINQPTPEITGEVEVEDITNTAGQGSNLVAQLGYRYETDPDYTWVNAEYKDDVGSSDRFKAQFTPDRAGKWYYAMRFSADNGLTWDQKILGYKVNKFFDNDTIVMPFDVMLTWSQDPKTTQTITWKTDSDVAESYVQYAEKSNEAAFPGVNASVKAEGKAYITQYVTGNANVYTATLTGLKPGTAYVYRVGAGTKWSDVATFTTEATTVGSFQFLIFGDSQSGRQEESDYAKWGETVNTAYRANPEAKFMVNNGDIVEKGSYEHWHKWFEGAEGVIGNIPEMPVPGNHEYYSTYNVNEQADNFKMQFNLPQNGPERLKGLVYSYDYGDVHIAVMNSQQTEANANQTQDMGDILAEQATWLDKDLKNTTKKWKIVFYHKASYYSRASRAADAEKVKLAFQPVMDKYHVDLVFGAHDHTITRTYPIYNNNFVDSPSKGTVYYITGRSGNKNYNDPSKQVWDAYYKNDTEDTNYLTVNVNGDKLTVKVLEENGNILDEYTIDKAAGTGTPNGELPKISIAKAENLTALTNNQTVGKKTDDITAEVYSGNVTNYVGRGVHILAQLGYKLRLDTEYTWVNAAYSADKDNNDVYQASFVPGTTGKWDYVMRFSGDAGATWTATEAKTMTVVSSNADLKALTLSSGTLTPAFGPGTTSYSVSVANGVTNTSVTALVYDSSSALTVNGAPVASGQASGAIALNVGSNSIAIVVKAQDGTMKTYTVTVKREAASTPIGGGQSGGSAPSTGTTPPPATSTVPTTPTTNTGTTPPISTNPKDPKANPFQDKVINEENVIKTISDSIAATKNKNIMFSDISKHWGLNDIELAVKLRIVGGYQDGTFRPDVSVTRAEFAAMICRAFGLEAGQNSESFSDTASNWASAYIRTLAAKGIVNGYRDGSFRPGSSISRAEMVTILARILDLDRLATGTPAAFTDVSNDNWAKNAIGQAFAAGLIQGVTASTVKPDNQATRAEAITVILRALKSDSRVKELIQGM